MHHFWAMWKQQHLTHRQAKNCPIRWLSFPLNQGQNYAKFENFLLEGWNKIWRTWCFQFGMPPSSALKWSDTKFQTYTQSQKTKALPIVFKHWPHTNTPLLVPCTTSGPCGKQQHVTHRQAENFSIRWLSFPLDQGQNYAKIDNFLLERRNKIWRTWCFQFGMPPSSALKWSDTRFHTYTQSQKTKALPMVFKHWPHTNTPLLVTCTTSGPCDNNNT